MVWARDWCIRRKKQGLLAAHQNMLREVMLLGLISFLLVAFEDKLQEICGVLRPSISVPTAPASCANVLVSKLHTSTLMERTGIYGRQCEADELAVDCDGQRCGLPLLPEGTACCCACYRTAARRLLRVSMLLLCRKRHM